MSARPRGVRPSARTRAVACFVCLAAVALHAHAQLKINEVYYNINGPQGANQFVEIYNAGASNIYLDGLVLTDEAGSGIEGIFQFPGSGTDHLLPPGGFVLVASDADGTDGFDPDLSLADWECYKGVGDYDNPTVSNLILVGGELDFSLYARGDNVILADGTDTSAPIAASTILDGVNFANGGGELARLSPTATDSGPGLIAPAGTGLSRCPNGSDSDVSSAADFFILAITPGLTNDCSAQPSISISDTTLPEGDTVATYATFEVTLSQPSSSTITVHYATSDGSATGGLDFVSVAAGVVTFPISVTSETANVQLIPDLDEENDETFLVNLSVPTNATLDDLQATGLILDDDNLAFLDLSGSSTVLTCTWWTACGRTYRIEYTTNLCDPVWIDLYGDIVATSATESATHTVPKGPGMYRVLKLE